MQFQLTAIIENNITPKKITKPISVSENSYMDDFYSTSNIVGFTGDLYDSPTVYFSRSGKVGRIVQNHWLKENIGRGQVTSPPAGRYYVGANRFSDCENNKFTERFISNDSGDGFIFHTSRRSFKTARNETEIKELSLAITQFAKLKPSGKY